VAEWFGGWQLTRTAARLLFRAAGVGLFLLCAAWQKQGDRRYAAFGSGEYDSLWRPGFVATVVCDVILVALLLPLILALA
jgi:hypothetical protein